MLSKILRNHSGKQKLDRNLRFVCQNRLSQFLLETAVVFGKTHFKQVSAVDL